MNGPDPIVSTRGDISRRDVDHFVDKITAIYDNAPRPVLHAAIRLEKESNPRNERPAVAEVTLDISGRSVRAHLAAATMSEATDLAVARLKRQISELQERSITRNRRPRPNKMPPHEWRHGDSTVDSDRPDWFDRPNEDRELVRRKTFALHAMAPDEAAFDMELLHHDFYLFTNANTGQDNLIASNGDNKYALYQLDVGDEQLEQCSVPIALSEATAPHASVDDALGILDGSNDKYLFFFNTDYKRGNVVYRRYDGHYGLITPAV